ncbi:hypothetical protein ACU4GR_03180 [Methylobacterium oryzae CBMB20]
MKADDQGIAPTADARVDALLRRPLTADGAVQVALLRNRGLQAAFNDLGVSEAQYVQATLPPSPRLSITQWGLGFNTEIERSVAASVLELATLPVRAEIARQRFTADQYNAAEQVLRLGARRGAILPHRGGQPGDGFPRTGPGRRRIRVDARHAAGRDGRAEQAGAGARACFLQRARRAARQGAGAAAGGAGAPDPPARALGAGDRVPACPTACRPCPGGSSTGAPSRPRR